MGNRYFNAQVPVAVSVCTPAIPMFAIAMWAYREDGGEWKHGHEIYPVVAVRSVLARLYECSGHRPNESPEHAEMVESGWEYNHTTEINEPLFLAEGELMSFSDASRFADCCLWRLRACEGGRKELDDTLEAFVAESLPDAIKKAEADEERWKALEKARDAKLKKPEVIL